MVYGLLLTFRGDGYVRLMRLPNLTKLHVHPCHYGAVGSIPPRPSRGELESPPRSGARGGLSRVSVTCYLLCKHGGQTIKQTSIYHTLSRPAAFL